MHQKYIVNVDAATVLTGTANMSTDASMRHSEHRIRVVGNRDLADQFATDFATIWNRVNQSSEKPLGGPRPA
jgi:phosphatidylserine/phosphatidylglycerophosphate/cardiolipin synthase-like enzyme